MAKKIKYPRKLRQTLEKMAVARVAREKPEESNPFLTLWWEFLLPKQVHTMFSRLEGDDIPSLKLITSMTMRDPRKVKVISPLAPWLLGRGQKTPPPEA